MISPVKIFERKLFTDEGDISFTIKDSIGDYVGGNVVVNDLNEGESFVDFTTAKEFKRINGILHEQIIKNDKVYWQRIE